MIAVNINVTKIDKAKLYAGKNGKYLDLVLIENRDGPDQYGNDYMVCQSVSKEEREAGKRGAILGNAKIIGKKPTAAKSESHNPTSAPASEPREDDVPF